MADRTLAACLLNLRLLRKTLLPFAPAVSYSVLSSRKRKPFPILQNVSVDDLPQTVYEKAKENMKHRISKYVKYLEISKAGGSDKAKKKHISQNKLLARDRLKLILDDESEFLELSPLAGLGMEYGDVPNAGLITGIGQVNGVYCMLLVNDATVKGGTVYPITLKKQLRAQEIAEENHLPCVYSVDSGGAYLPLQSEIFPDKNHGGRVFYNQCMFSAKGIPQVAIVCGNCTAGGAYIPTLADEAIIIQKVGRIFLGGPPLVKAATGEVVDVDDLGGAVLHSTVSGCTDYYTEVEEEACSICRDVVASYNIPDSPQPLEWDDPEYDPNDLIGLVPDCSIDYDPHKIIARLVDGSRFHEFKALYGHSLITGFTYLQGYLVGVVANKGEITGDDALKGAHFVQMCSERSIPLVFLQNSCTNLGQNEEHSGELLGETVKNHAKMLSAVALASVPKMTVIVGGSWGINNYLMAGRCMSPNFVFLWPSAQIGAQNPEILMELELETCLEDLSEDAKSKFSEKLNKETSALYSSSRVWDDGIILPQDTRQVLGQCLRIMSQKKVTERRDAGVIRM